MSRKKDLKVFDLEKVEKKQLTVEDVYTRIFETFTPEKLLEIIQDLPEDKKIYYLDSLFKSHQAHQQFKTKLELEKSKMNPLNNMDTLTIIPPDFSGED